MMWEGGTGTCLPALSWLAQAASSSLSSAPGCWRQTLCAPDLVGLHLLEISLKLSTLSTNLPMPVPGKPWKNTEETQDDGLIVINLCAVGGQAEETFSHHTTVEKISLDPITWKEVNPASWVVSSPSDLQAGQELGIRQGQTVFPRNGVKCGFGSSCDVDLRSDVTPWFMRAIYGGEAGLGMQPTKYQTGSVQP